MALGHDGLLASSQGLSSPPGRFATSCVAERPGTLHQVLHLRVERGIPFLPVSWHHPVAAVSNTAGDRPMGRKPARPAIRLPDTDRTRPGRIVSHPRSLQKHVWRARIILCLGAGCGLAGTMRRTGRPEPTVWRWWDRCPAGGVDSLLRASTRPPRTPVPAATVQAIIGLAMSPPPPTAATGPSGPWPPRAGPDGHHRAPDPGAPWPAAPSGQGPRCRRTLHEPAGSCRRAPG